MHISVTYVEFSIGCEGEESKMGAVLIVRLQGNSLLSGCLQKQFLGRGRNSSDRFELGP